MRRKDKEIIEKSAIEEIITRSQICHVAMADSDIPYVVPMCFGYQKDTVFLHSASKGRKLGILRTNPNVCLAFEIDTEIVESEQACSWGMKYRSAIAFGKLSFIDNIEEKREALKVIMKQYSKDVFPMPDQVLENTTVMKVQIENMTSKKSGYE